MKNASLVVGIATRNRARALIRCLRSLTPLEDMIAGITIVDDHSTAPVEPVVRAELPSTLLSRIRFQRNEVNQGVAAARNTIVQSAESRWVLNLDDDAFIISREAVESALTILQRDPNVAVVAFAQSDQAGIPYPHASQSNGSSVPCYVASFIGFAHLVRRDAFLSAGGFRERLGIHSEEKDLCLRLLDCGFRVVYLPNAAIAHVADESGRDARKYLHQTVRNTTLSALYNEPFPLVMAGVSLRLWRYFPMRKGWQIDDPGGFRKIMMNLLHDLPAVITERKPVKWSTWREWRRMTTNPPEPYTAPVHDSADTRGQPA